MLPFAPGGAIDIFARAYAPETGRQLGKPFVVENRPGAGTVVAADSVARAAPDGHTMLVAPSPLAINATLYKKLPYDPPSDFMPVAHVADIPLVLVVQPSLPVHIGRRPGQVRQGQSRQLAFATSGPGSTLHLSARCSRA